MEGKEHEKQLWHDVYVAMAGGTFNVDKEAAAGWADFAVDRFSEKFSPH